jgi:hypothetical protein
MFDIIVVLCCRWSMSQVFCSMDNVFHMPHMKISSGVRSGLLRGQAIDPPLPIHWFGNLASVLYICQKLHWTVTFNLNAAYRSTYWAFSCMDVISLIDWMGPNINMNTTVQSINHINNPCDTCCAGQWGQNFDSFYILQYECHDHISQIYPHIWQRNPRIFFGDLIQTGCLRRKGQYSERSQYQSF